MKKSVFFQYEPCAIYTEKDFKQLKITVLYELIQKNFNRQIPNYKNLKKAIDMMISIKN